MAINAKNLCAGLIFVTLGLFFGVAAWIDLPIGAASHMGPGYFPTLLSCMLFALGFLIALQAVGQEPSPIGEIPWRGLLFLLASPIVFGVTVRGLGFIPAIALVALISAFASQRSKPLNTLMLTTGITVFCVGVFYYGLGMPVRLFGPWLGA